LRGHELSEFSLGPHQPFDSICFEARIGGLFGIGTQSGRLNLEAQHLVDRCRRIEIAGKMRERDNCVHLIHHQIAAMPATIGEIGRSSAEVLALLRSI
jgi:hypothetical protein